MSAVAAVVGAVTGVISSLLSQILIPAHVSNAPFVSIKTTVTRAVAVAVAAAKNGVATSAVATGFFVVALENAAVMLNRETRIDFVILVVSVAVVIFVAAVIFVASVTARSGDWLKRIHAFNGNFVLRL